MLSCCRVFLRIPILALLVLVIGAVVLLVVLLVPSGGDDAVVFPEVETLIGSIQGRRASDGDYNIFLGIPYALVNASNHFGTSTPYPRFEETFVADNDLARCPQMNSNNNPVGSIDCLQLNIFVPHTASDTNRLPVMVWIEGNDFETSSKSSSLYGPKYLMSHDVIYVAINYRVGAYGFMCLDIPEVPGNQGLKDQVLALRWVKDHIGSFGGNASEITVFGTSAGAQSIDFHILSDNEQLFQKAIMQSGSSLAATVFTEHVKDAPIRIAQRLGFNSGSMNEVLSYLSSVGSTLVVQAWNELGLVFKPCTEMEFENVESFLTRPWVDADKPKARGMSILTGYNEQEQLLHYVTPDAFENYNVINERLQAAFNFDDQKLISKERNINNFYFGDKDITPDLIVPVVEFDSDFTYVHPVHRSINKYLENLSENVFFYVFSYDGGQNAAKVTANVTIGSAAHGDEVGYLFDMDIFQEEPTAEDQLIIDRMTTMWTNFAKYSNPTPQETTLLPVTWSPVTDMSYNYLTINHNMTLSRRPSYDRMAFWDLFYRYNGKYQTGISTD